MNSINQEQVESILTEICSSLTIEIRTSNKHHKPADFEALARSVFLSRFPSTESSVVQRFPDIVFGRYGVEIKVTENDSWRCIANSVSEGNRAKGVEKIYVVFAKIGGTPEVKWSDYGEAIMHVRTSHVPRFEIQIGAPESIFSSFGISYTEFSGLEMHDKMVHIKKYAKARLKPGERLWWLDETSENPNQHALELNVRLYMDLTKLEKRQCRAEAALLCPQVFAPGTKRDKYQDAVSYLMTYRGILCPQARDLFSAGSVAGQARGGDYVQRAIMDIEQELIKAAKDLEATLFIEYWGEHIRPENRIKFWLKQADLHAKGWVPSEIMFRSSLK